MQILVSTAKPGPQFSSLIENPQHLLAVTPDLAAKIGVPSPPPDESLVAVTQQTSGLSSKQMADLSAKLGKRGVGALKLALPHYPGLSPVISGGTAILSTYQAWDALTKKEDFSILDAGLKTTSALADTADLLTMFKPIAKLHPNLTNAVDVFVVVSKVGDIVLGSYLDINKAMNPKPKAAGTD